MSQILSGIIVSAKTPKSVVVEVSRLVKHPKYQKYFRRSKRYLAHDEVGRQVGERVKIVETKPLSRRKRFKIL